MAYPLVKFTASAAAAATVRMDLNADSGSMKTYPDADTLDLGSLELEGDADALGVEYADRRISFDLIINGTRAQATAQMSLLARELVRESNWLMYQQDATAAPVWFRLKKSSPGALALTEVDNAKTANYWRIGVALNAEPLAYGERVTLSAVTVNNNPASGSNPCSWTTVDIIGDAPAPCRLSVNPSNSGAMPGYRWMIAHAAIDSGSYTPTFWQVGASDGWTAGTDTGASTANAAYSGGSYRAVSFSTATMTTRLSGNAPSTPPRGRYKVLVRVARSDTDSTFSMRFGQNVGAAYIYGDTVLMDRAPSTATGHATWVDLGEFNFPRGSGQVPDDLVATPITPNVAFQAARESGTGSMHIDCFALVPIEIANQVSSSVIFSEFTRIGIDSGGGLGVWDGDAETFWAFNASSGLFTPMPENSGSYPVLVPGMTNVLHLLQQVNASKPFFLEDSSDTISVSSSVTLSYNPRWHYIGDN